MNFATNTFSLTPGFSPVAVGEDNKNRFNSFFAAGKPLKRLTLAIAFFTRLKPGVNAKLGTFFRNDQ